MHTKVTGCLAQIERWLYERFVLDETVKSVLCVPVVTPDNDCFAVLEFYRDVTQPSFGREDLQIVIVVTGWMGAAIHQNQQRLALQKQQELNDYLLELTKCYLANTLSTDKLVSEVVVSFDHLLCRSKIMF